MPLYAFNQLQLRRVVKQLLRAELEPREDLRTGQHFDSHPVETLAGTAYEPITARNGAVPGTGRVQAKKFVTGTGAHYADPVGNIIHCLNFGDAITQDSYVICHRHRESGKWLVEVPRGGSNVTVPTSQGFQASLTTTQDFSTQLANPAVLPFTADAAVTSGVLWTFAGDVLTVGAACVGRYHLDGALKALESTGGMRGVASIWMEHSTDNGGTWSAVERSGQNVGVIWPTEIQQSGGTVFGACPAEASEGPPAPVHVSRRLAIAAGEKFRIVFQQANGPHLAWSVLKEDTTYITVAGGAATARLGTTWGFDLC